MKQKSSSATFSENQMTPGIQFSGATSKGGNQPPRKRMVVIALIRIMLAYSPRKKSAKLIAEYSTKKPATSSDSPSGRSKGARFVSARVEIKKITNMGSSGIANQTVCRASTMSVSRSDPTQRRTVMITKHMETS